LDFFCGLLLFRRFFPRLFTTLDGLGCGHMPNDYDFIACQE
jgi:hypothetical protein